jgi:hypothetical protein
MAFTGRRQVALDEIDEDKEASLDPWAKCQLPGEEAATKALDELRLTPNLDGFLCPALVNALDPNDSKNYDAGARRYRRYRMAADAKTGKLQLLLMSNYPRSSGAGRIGSGPRRHRDREASVRVSVSPRSACGA